MKRTHPLLFVLAAAMLCSCGAGGTSSPAQSQPDESSSRTRTRSSDSTPISTSLPTEAQLPDTLPTIAGTEIAYVEGLRSGGESDAKMNPGFLYEWHGDGGDISSFAYSDGEYSFSYLGGWAWYGCQLFYMLPYAEAGDAYTIRLRVYSDVEGDITINGIVTHLVWGWNVITVDFPAAETKNTTLSIQLGVNANEEQGIVAQSLQGSFFKMKDIEVYDAAHTYHKVEFKQGEETVKSIMVRAGQKVAAPLLSIPAGKIFVGWFNGETAFNPNAPVGAAATYSARIVDESEITTHNVSILLNGNAIDTLKVADGNPANVASVVAPFGYQVSGFFLDAAFTEAYANEPITADTTLYMKAKVVAATYYHNGEVAREERQGANGEFIVEYHNNGYTDGWNIQVNFAPLPVGEAGKTYVFSAEYTLVGTTANGSYQIYDNASIASGTLAPTDTFVKVEAEYDGAFLTAGNKFTFELGLAKPAEEDGTVVFTVRNPLIREKA